MRNKLTSLFAAIASLLVIISCSAPDEYLEKTGAVNKVQTSSQIKTSGASTTVTREGDAYSFNYEGTEETTVYVYAQNHGIKVYGIDIGGTLWRASDCPAGTYTSSNQIISNGKYVTVVPDSSFEVLTQKKTYNGNSFTSCVKIGTGSKSGNYLRFTVTGAVAITIYTACKDSDAESKLCVEYEWKEGLKHPVDEDSEGYYIADKYWYSGELVTSNSRLGEIWSFDAKAGQQYAVYLYEKSNAFYVYDGDSVTNFSTTYLKCCEQKYKYSYSEDLYDRPALITPKKKSINKL